MIKEKIIEHGDGRYSIDENGYITNNDSGCVLMTCKSACKKYMRVKINGGGESRDYKIHILLAKAFIPNPNNYTEVNHKDGNGLNNNLENLEWVTRKENMVHAVHNGLASTKLKEADVHEICKLISSGSKLSNENIGKTYGVGHTAISKIRQGKSWVEITKLYGFGSNSSTNNTNAKHRRKLSDEQVIEICKLLNKKELSAVNIGLLFGVKKTTINDISAGNTYTEITVEYLNK